MRPLLYAGAQNTALSEHELSALQVPAQEREQVIAFVAEIDMLAQAQKVIDAVLASLSVQFDLKG